ncbi:MAG: PAS domain S-box protein, partial [Mucilaginibacter sp.]
TDANCVILRVNKAFAKSTGYTAEEAVGRKMNLLKSGRHDATFYAAMWESINRNGTWQGEVWDKRKNGEIYPKWLTITAVKNAADAVIHYVGRHIDITERKQTEQELNQLKAMSDISLNGFWITDLMGNMLQVNEAYAKMVGYSIAELKTMHISQVEAIEGPEQVKAHIAKVVAQGYDQFETRHRHKDGHTIDIEISAVFLPEFQQFCMFCRDITERKLMEDELKASEAKFRSLIDASPVPLALNDEQSSVIFLNPAFVQTFGYSLDDIPTLADWRRKAYPDPDYRHWVETTWQTTLEKAKQEKTNFPPLELAIRCKNNSIKTVMVAAAAIQHDFTGMHLVILYDITQRKQQEQRDKEHLDELAHVTRLGLMGEMASGIAHEVNQPLAAISSYTQVSLNLINSEHPDLAKLTEILDKTQQQALRAGGIIHHMRQFVKSHVIHRSTADVNTLIHNAVGLCIAELKQNNISLTFELDNNLPSICVDQIQIEQVIINLVRNSIEALQNLPAKQQRELIIHSHLTLNNRIQVRVKDNGPGLDEDQRQKISTPFYTTKADGMGMGLSISRSLIEAHKGTLHFNSMPGKGSAFYFTLPIEKSGEV